MLVEIMIPYGSAVMGSACEWPRLEIGLIATATIRERGGGSSS